MTIVRLCPVTRQCLTARLACALLVISISGCATRVPYPADWPAALPVESWCAGPAGSFFNAPVGASNEARGAGVELKQVFFGDLLGGFDVTHIEFESLEGGALRVSPWAGTVRLREQLILEPSSASCVPDRWSVVQGWEGDGYWTATALFMTAGMLMPLASKVEFILRANAEGQLVVRVRQHSVNTVALVIPFRTLDRQDWFAYAPYASVSGSDAH